MKNVMAILFTLVAGIGVGWFVLWAMERQAVSATNWSTQCKDPVTGELFTGRNQYFLRDADGFEVEFDYDFRCKRVHTGRAG